MTPLTNHLPSTHRQGTSGPDLLAMTVLQQKMQSLTASLLLPLQQPLDYTVQIIQRFPIFSKCFQRISMLVETEKGRRQPR